MPTNTHEEVFDPLRCFWPEEFVKRKNFVCQTENETYLGWLRPLLAEESEDEDGDADSEVDGDHDAGAGAGAAGDDEDDEDEIEGLKERREKKNGKQIDDEITKDCNRYGDVRLFMTGATGDEDTLQYKDQVRQVAKFCERSSKERDSGIGITSMALLDDRNSRGAIVQTQGDFRPYRGPLTTSELCKELSKKRFRTKVDQNGGINVSEEESADADRRLIFITNLDAPGIDALTTTASRTQAPALRDLLYKHLTSRTCISVTIPEIGFKTFTLDFHIPYYVLRESKKLRRDARENINGESLRYSWDLSFLSGPNASSSSTDKPRVLHEAQMSVAVTGIDHLVWAAYGIFDTYFGSKDSVHRYHRLNWKNKVGIGRPDPLAAGQIDANTPIWTPRKYFLRVLQIRIHLVLTEWNKIIDVVENKIKQSRTIQEFPVLSKDPKIRKAVREFCEWNKKVAWDEFKRKKIGYFLYDGESATFSTSLRPSLMAIDTTFWELKVLKKTLEGLKTELCEDNPQGVSHPADLEFEDELDASLKDAAANPDQLHAYLGLENNEATLVGQRIAGDAKVLALITIIFYPMVLSTSLFSTQGVLPFKPKLAYFIYVLVSFTFIVLAILFVSFNWTSWFQTISNYVLSLMAEVQVPKAIIDKDNRLNAEEIDTTTSRNPQASKPRFFSRKLRNSNPSSPWDPEKGSRKGMEKERCSLKPS